MTFFFFIFGPGRKFEVFSSQKTPVQVTSQVTDVKVQLRLQAFFDFVESKSTNLWLKPDSSPSQVTRVHTSVK